MVPPLLYGAMRDTRRMRARELRRLLCRLAHAVVLRHRRLRLKPWKAHRQIVVARMNGAKRLRLSIAGEHGGDVQGSCDAAFHEMQAADGQERRDVGRTSGAGHSATSA